MLRLVIYLGNEKISCIARAYLSFSVIESDSAVIVGNEVICKRIGVALVTWEMCFFLSAEYDSASCFVMEFIYLFLNCEPFFIHRGYVN